MIGTVESVDKSKSGKSWRVKISGKYYGANFDSHLDDAKGKAIDFNYKTTEFGEWIESWAYAQGAPAAAAQVAAKAMSNGDRWWLPFVSNQVAHAIAAGKITNAMEMNTWAKAAKECIISVDIL